MATVPLGYISIVTLLLCERRTSINANAIIDDILWHLALTGLAINAQAIIPLLRAITPSQQKGLSSTLLQPILTFTRRTALASN